MTSLRRFLLLALACAPPILAADQLTGFPFQNETLHYRVNWVLTATPAAATPATQPTSPALAAATPAPQPASPALAAATPATQPASLAPAAATLATQPASPAPATPAPQPTSPAPAAATLATHAPPAVTGGRGLGEATLTARKTGDTGWDFDMSTTVGVPVAPISDTYKSTAVGADLCTATLRREISHGPTTVIEKTEFDQHTNQAQRQTVVPAGGGNSEFSIPTCGRDALTFLYVARREMGQGRVAPAGKVFFGSGYEVKMVYTGAMDVPVAGKPVVTDHVNVSVKGPASDFTFEMFYARDAARTPLLVKIPLSAGTVSLELVR